MELIRQLGPAVVALQQSGAGLCHGAITADRVIVTREGRLVLVEHVLASALASLRFPAVRVRADLGLAVPADADPVAFNQRLDVIQLAVVAMSLLLGRRLDPSEYPANAAALLDEFTRTDPGNSMRLRPWLERALQMGAMPFDNAEQAMGAFDTLSGDVAAAPAASAAPTPAVAAKPAALPVNHTPAVHVQLTPAPPAAPAAAPEASTEESDVADIAPNAPKQWKSGRGATVVRWVAAVLALVAIGEGLVIAGLFTRPTSVVIAPPPPRATLLATQLPAVINIPEPTTTPAAVEPAAAAAGKPADAAAAARPDGAPAERPAAPAASGSRFGGVKLACPIELQVFEGTSLLGSTAGPIAINEGAHTLDLVNDTLGFRTQRAVTVRAGQMTSINVPLPDGRVSINAVPWADVTIDGNPAGQTPLANLALRIGQHDVVFRHPQLGEQHQTITVKVDGLTRVSAVLQK